MSPQTRAARLGYYSWCKAAGFTEPQIQGLLLVGEKLASEGYMASELAQLMQANPSPAGLSDALGRGPLSQRAQRLADYAEHESAGAWPSSLVRSFKSKPNAGADDLTHRTAEAIRAAINSGRLNPSVLPEFKDSVSAPAKKSPQLLRRLGLMLRRHPALAALGAAGGGFALGRLGGSSVSGQPKTAGLKDLGELVKKVQAAKGTAVSQAAPTVKTVAQQAVTRKMPAMPPSDPVVLKTLRDFMRSRGKTAGLRKLLGRVGAKSVRPTAADPQADALNALVKRMGQKPVGAAQVAPAAAATPEVDRLNALLKSLGPSKGAADKAAVLGVLGKGLLTGGRKLIGGAKAVGSKLMGAGKPTPSVPGKIPPLLKPGAKVPGATGPAAAPGWSQQAQQWMSRHPLMTAAGGAGAGYYAGRPSEQPAQPQGMTPEQQQQQMLYMMMLMRGMQASGMRM